MVSHIWAPVLRTNAAVQVVMQVSFTRCLNDKGENTEFKNRYKYILPYIFRYIQNEHILKSISSKLTLNERAHFSRMSSRSTDF